MPSVKKESNSKVEGLSKREDKKSINIRWNSGLFFQIGLVISMLFVFLVVESNLGFSELTYSINERKELNEVALKNFVVEVIPEKKVVEKQVVKERKPIEPVASNKFKEMDNTSILKETDLAKTEVDFNKASTTPKKSIVEIPADNSNKNILTVDNVPIFPGCEYLKTNDERKSCLNDKVNAFINRKFNVDKFSDKYAGRKNRIDVQFTVDSNGQIVNIKTRAPFEDLGLEAKRVIENLPKMIPGYHNNHAVDVIYSVPIMLNIDY